MDDATSSTKDGVTAETPRTVEPPAFRVLLPGRILHTAEALSCRISERFPDSNLNRVAQEFVVVARDTTRAIERHQRPIVWLRLLVGLCVLLVLMLVGAALFIALRNQTAFQSISDFVQGLEAAINEFIFLGLAIAFLVGLETRLKRARLLRAIHTLRSMTHIIDMHQLTKDPERIGRSSDDTASSPARTMTPFELTRYLDYCSELLALISKVAALHAQSMADAVVLGAVSEVENLAQDLRRNIWQKIMILDRMRTRHPAPPGDVGRHAPADGG